jgi:hypothetical protein
MENAMNEQQETSEKIEYIIKKYDLDNVYNEKKKRVRISNSRTLFISELIEYVLTVIQDEEEGKIIRDEINKMFCKEFIKEIDDDIELLVKYCSVYQYYPYSTMIALKHYKNKFIFNLASRDVKLMIITCGVRCMLKKEYVRITKKKEMRLISDVISHVRM